MIMSFKKKSHECGLKILILGRGRERERERIGDKVRLPALNFALVGAWQFSSGKGHFFDEKVNFAKGTTAKAKGTTATAVGAMGYFEAWELKKETSV